MDEATFEQKLNELVNEIGSIPQPQRDKLIILARRSRDSQRKLRESVDNLQGALDYLRVSIKYLVFDLEATRRENKCLRDMLEDKGSQQ